MARFQMALHGGYRVTYQAKRHVPVRRRLVLNKHVNVAVAAGGFQAIENVAEILTEVILNKRAGFQFKCAEVADGLQLCREMQLHEIPGNIRLRQELPECRIVGCGRGGFLFHWSML
ncbi:hypothetical protein SFB9_5837 [Klebsiella michiganensis]|nr:hypothetical protein SFB9_5837 [Klebsiella michiganensis]CZX01857.1 Uncharacterised protein [Enterobacter hormaechei]